MFEIVKDLCVNSKATDDKPMVSYCLFAYKQERYISSSLDSALAQTYSPLEIIISDDCSSDQTFAIIQDKVRSYEGPHRVVINRNERNLGIGGHVSFVTALSSGDYVVTVGGDDISSPRHVEMAVGAIQTSDGAYMVDFDATTINEDGDVIVGRRAIRDSVAYNLEDFITYRRKISSFAPGRIINRDVVDQFPPIASSCPTEDTVFVLRALLLGGVRREPIDIIKYRRTESSVSSSANIAQLSVEGIINQYHADLDHALVQGLISEENAQRLRRRIAFESFKRLNKMRYGRRGIRSSLNRWKVGIYKQLYRRGFL